MTNRSTAPLDPTDTPLLRLLFDRGSEPMWVLDLTGSVVRANAAARAGFTVRRPVFGPLLELALDHELPGSGSWSAVIPVVAEGEVELQASATLISLDDTAQHFLCVLKQAPDSPVVDTSHDDQLAMMWMADGDAADVERGWFSKPWLDFTGATPSTQQGDAWTARIHPEDQERVRGIAEASIQARTPFTLDYRLQRHDGSWRWVMDSGLPRHDGDGRFCGYVGSCIDIHERKELEDRLAERTRALRLADKRKDEFLSMLSHELRNPLAPIANAAGLLRLMEKDRPELARVRVIVERQVEQLRRLIGDMVDMTRLTQHKISLTREPVQVSAVIEGALRGAQARVDAGGHKVEVDIADPALEVVADPARLQQAIGNLVANAAKFMTRPGVVRIAASVDDGALAIRVVDQGEGITAEFLPHVFDLFAQGDQSLARAHGGLGVGLSIARRIVQLHGGDIEAMSEGAGKGAEFVIRLPLRYPHPNPLPHAGEGAYSSSSPFKGTVEYSLSRL